MDTEHNKMDLDDEKPVNLPIKDWDNRPITTVIIGMCTFYILIFVFGLVGNICVIAVVINIFRKLGQAIQNKNVFLYILSLSSVDSLVLCTLPLLACKAYTERWVFGKFFCKIYLTVEFGNKMLSTFLLVALSGERYLAVCKSNSFNITLSVNGTVKIIGILTALVAVLLTPVYIFADKVEIYQLMDSHNERFNISIPSCLLTTENFAFWFAIYMFIAFFIIPSALIFFFYSRILHKLYVHKTALASSTHISSHIPFYAVTRSAFLLIIFYLICWTPYWCITLYSSLMQKKNHTMEETYIMHVSHSLVYVHSAFDWILYAFMNKNLHQSNALASSTNKRRSNAENQRVILNDEHFV